ncbi:TPA: glycoside hydrolase family 95 protein [Streptococcus pneumoniae]|nr:glycoside hydrolase family 95 protein [Streptococcus pneumoniae]
MKLWYKKAASNWNEALPIGNGHLGGMIYGSATKECIQLNDETIWYRGKSDRNNPDSLLHLKKIREYLLDGEIQKAEELIKLTMFATPRDQSHYELLGELYIEHIDIQSCALSLYERELDLDTAISNVVFEPNSCNLQIKREYFTSFNKNILCCRIVSSVQNTLNLNINLGRNKRFNDEVSKLDSSTILMSASAGGRKGVQFKVVCHSKVTDGEVSVLGETIVIRNATEVFLYLKSMTDYWGNIDISSLQGEFSSIDYFTEKDEHVKKYQEQFNRVDFKLDYSKDCLSIPTNLLLENTKKYSNYLTNLLFHYGRYLLISSSQPNGLPANLQGIWCDELNPIWGSKYTININTQMNYWMVGPSVSPENKYRLKNGIEGNACLSSTIDNQILRYFCDSCIGIAKQLGDNSDFISRVKELKKKLPRTKIGSNGQIQEWLEDYEEVEPGHRHTSPLFGLYPYNEIDIHKTPELAEAAKITINRRLSNANFLSSQDREQAINNWLVSGLHASTQTGWSAAWLIHFFARLYQGEPAYNQINGLLNNATLGNLFLDHPPFQIDGNLGLVSGICELLVQSHHNWLSLIPALPSAWSEGEVKGFRVRGGYKVSFAWKNGDITFLKLEGGNKDQKVRVRIYGKNTDVQNIELVFNSEKIIELNF